MLFIYSYGKITLCRSGRPDQHVWPLQYHRNRW